MNTIIILLIIYLVPVIFNTILLKKYRKDCVEEWELVFFYFPFINISGGIILITECINWDKINPVKKFINWLNKGKEC